MYEWAEFERFRVISAAMTHELDEILVQHVDKGPHQEDLAFAFWRPSVGSIRFTAVLTEVVLPEEGDRVLQGNVAFTGQYLDRVLDMAPDGAGVALIHSHFGPGWQDMSDDDVFAESVRMGGAVAGRTGLPVLGLTWGTDRSWSARLWLRTGRRQYDRRWCDSTRVVGERLHLTFHPELAPPPDLLAAQAATVSVWGEDAQADLARAHVGIVGLGSVGSIIAEALARMGVQKLTVIDHDIIEERNLDRTLGASRDDIGSPKVDVAKRTIMASSTATRPEINAVPASLLTSGGCAAALDCDVLFSCVDRPWPRFLLNALSYAHLIPVIDGGILARVNESGHLLHVDWRIHTVGPGRRCLFCLGAVRRSDVALDREGLLEDPDYIKGLSLADRERYARRNVFPFSLSVAAHEALHFAGLVTGVTRVSGVGPQRYHAYPGKMEVECTTDCDPDCEFNALTATAADMVPNLAQP